MENKPQMGLGEYLRGERERRHITIEQVASATKINIKLLHALESDNYDALPAKPFVRGFVTSYTRYVGLDHREVLARFDPYLDERSGQKFRRPADTPHIFVEREGTAENSKMWLSIGMVSFIFVGVVVFVVLKPSLHRHHAQQKGKTTVSNEELITVMPPPLDSTTPAGPAAPPKPTEAATAENAPKAPSKEAEPAPAPLPTTQAAAPEIAKAPAATAVSEKPILAEEHAKDSSKPATEKKTAAEKKSSEKKTAADKNASEDATQQASATSESAAKPIKIPPIPYNEVKYRLIVHALDDAWVKYQVDDRPLQQYTLKKDKTIWVRARESIRFQTAKPTALEISRDNKEFKPFGSGARTMIIPKDAEAQFKNAPFVPPNPAYLSTSTQ